ncbi:thymidylate synthase (FAD), partial [Streptomyces griseus]
MFHVKHQPRDGESAKPHFRSDVTVELVKSDARDADVLFAARVST